MSIFRARRTRGVQALIIGSASVLAMVVPATAHAATGTNYVGLGDSYASGPVIPTQVDLSCTRSDHNFAHLVAQAEPSTALTDASCGGATTSDMTHPQSGTDNPPQFDALRPDTGLVTLSISGNDINFIGIIETCSSMGLTHPAGSPCTDHYTAGGTDQIAQAITATAPKVAAVLQGIHQRSPRARVLVVGYLDILPLTGSCYGPNNTIAPGDYPYLNAKAQQLNGMLRDQAKANGDDYVDTYSVSVGHDLCQQPGTRWVEGLVPTAPAAPVHPNELGMQADTAQILATLHS